MDIAALTSVATCGSEKLRKKLEDAARGYVRRIQRALDGRHGNAHHAAAVVLAAQDLSVELRPEDAARAACTSSKKLQQAVKQIRTVLENGGATKDLAAAKKKKTQARRAAARAPGTLGEDTRKRRRDQAALSAKTGATFRVLSTTQPLDASVLEPHEKAAGAAKTDPKPSALLMQLGKSFGLERGFLREAAGLVADHTGRKLATFSAEHRAAVAKHFRKEKISAWPMEEAAVLCYLAKSIGIGSKVTEAAVAKKVKIHRGTLGTEVRLVHDLLNPPTINAEAEASTTSAVAAQAGAAGDDGVEGSERARGNVGSQRATGIKDVSFDPLRRRQSKRSTPASATSRAAGEPDEHSRKKSKIRKRPSAKEVAPSVPAAEVARAVNGADAKRARKADKSRRLQKKPPPPRPWDALEPQPDAAFLRWREKVLAWAATSEAAHHRSEVSCMQTN